MMSLEAIRELSAEQAEQAAADNELPFVPEAGDVDHWKETRSGLRIPNLGDHVPEGWERLDEDTWWFVDKGGFGSEGEAALTVDRFLDELEAYRQENPKHGYAIVEEGQFQLYVAPFRRTDELQRKLGTLKGTVEHMASDFDAPLDDFEEYTT